ncbi:hypothetical protein LINPERHAP2_LOCUS6265 [Linum perenne]
MGLLDSRLVRLRLEVLFGTVVVFALWRLQRIWGYAPSLERNSVVLSSTLKRVIMLRITWLILDSRELLGFTWFLLQTVT